MNKRFSVLSVIGICLVVVSLLLTAALVLLGRWGNDHCERLAAEMERLLPERSVGVPGSEDGMPVLQLDGEDFVALLEIPSCGMRLPVADAWDGSGIHGVPTRFCGSAYDHTLVIGGADDPRQFGFCDEIGHGEVVTVTDMTGAVFTYEVCRIDRSKTAEAQWLAKDGFDLTLFCRGLYSMEYIAVRCTFSGR